MTQGIFINGQRPRSKKQIREAVATGDQVVKLQATSAFGNEYDGDVRSAPDGVHFFVGPDPERIRNFYGQIVVDRGKITVR